MAEQVPLTAAEILRRKVKAQKRRHDAQDDETNGVSAESQTKLRKDSPKTQADIDEEIRRLEQELENDSDDSSDDSSTDSSSESDSEHSSKPRNDRGSSKEVLIGSGGNHKLNQTSDDGILSFSASKDARIEPLPASHLPKIQRKRRSTTLDQQSSSSSAKKAKKGSANRQGQASSGLEKAVQEVLDGYVARSSERIPFYCRVCAQQYENLHDFTIHKQSDFHKTAVRLEQKRTYCKLCRKQLTSPIQMKEHLQSRPHKERLAQSQARRQGGGGPRNRNPR